MLKIFLSDLHMGVNYPTNIYQQDFHEPYLKAILKYIEENAQIIEDVVILGDWMDLWMYPAQYAPPKADDIINANSNVFYPSNDGDFITCMDNIQGNLVYVPGNHDMTFQTDALKDHFTSLSKNNKKLLCTTDSGSISYTSESVYAEHGNRFTIFNMEDDNSQNRYRPLPIGYYMTKLGAIFCENKVKQSSSITNCSQIEGNDYPTASNILFDNIFRTVEDADKALSGKLCFSQFLLDMEAGCACSTDVGKLMIQMPDGSSISTADAAVMLSYLKIPVPDDLSNIKDFINFCEGIYSEAAANLDPYARQLFSSQNRIVVMGHTHAACLHKYNSKTSNIYANSGFLCPDQCSFKEGKKGINFVEIEEDASGTTVRLKEVEYGTYNIITQHSESL